VSPRKHTAPYGGPPAWLSAAHELPLAASSGYDAPRFVAECMAAFLAMGLSPRRAADAAANAMGEAAWGRALHHGNAGGWKITAAYSRAWRAANGPDGPKWWKAAGNADSEDSPWCFYRAFPTLADFLREWLAHFVPKPGDPAPYGDYREAGRAFWAGDPEWFCHLILAGYKGSPSKRLLLRLRAAGKPDTEHPSVRDHRSIAGRVLRMWAQSRLGVDVDGRWGPKSRAECRAVQRGAGLPETGELDDATSAALAPDVDAAHEPG
jgi:hypothetical protein